MVGNKCDMDEERVVPPEKGKHLADQLGETLLLKYSSAQVSDVNRTLMWRPEGGSCYLKELFKTESVRMFLNTQTQKLQDNVSVL